MVERATRFTASVNAPIRRVQRCVRHMFLISWKATVMNFLSCRFTLSSSHKKPCVFCIRKIVTVRIYFISSAPNSIFSLPKQHHSIFCSRKFFVITVYCLRVKGYKVHSSYTLPEPAQNNWQSRLLNLRKYLAVL